MKIAALILIVLLAVCSFAAIAGKPVDLTRIVKQ